MTIPSTARRAGPYLGNGATTAFSFSFKVFSTSDIKVTIVNSLDVETILVLNVDYTVTLNSNQETSPGGSITYPISGTPLPPGSKLTIIGNLPYDQPLDLPSGGNFSPLALENQLDRMTMQIQQLREQLNRTLTVPVTTPFAPVLPAPEASNLIGWNENGTNLNNYPIDDLATALAFATFRYDTFTGNGVTTQYTLSADPITLGNLDVAVGGVTQVPGADYTLLNNGILQFTSAPPAGVTILARFGEGVASGPSMDSYDVRYLPAGLGAVQRTVESKLRESVSVKDFGAVAYATQAEALIGVASNTAIAAAIAALPATGGVIEFPGQYYRLDGTVRIEKTGVIFKGKGGGIQTGLLQTQDVDSVYVDNAPAQPAPFGVEFHDIWFIGYRDTGTSTEGGFAALRIDDAFLCRISNCYFEHGRFGIQLNNASDIFIENCFLEDQPQMLSMVGCTAVMANNLRFINPNSLNSRADSYAININSTTVECQLNNLNITGQSSASKLAIGIQLVGSRNEISNVYVENATSHGIVLTGATCAGNALTNASIYGNDNGLRLETSATNNSIANINLSGNTTGLSVASTTGSGNNFANINTFSNTADAVVADAVTSTQLITAANFQLRSGTTANRPGSGSGKTTGYMYFDTTLGKPVWWLAPNWVDATGATV
jgi:hypothetical protein